MHVEHSLKWRKKKKERNTIRDACYKRVGGGEKKKVVKFNTLEEYQRKEQEKSSYKDHHYYVNWNMIHQEIFLS